MIKFENVTKKFGSLIALNSVDFEIKKGEFVFLTGASGAGKTTILKLILGEVTPDSGNLIVNGFNLKNLPSKDLPKYRQKIGTVFQDYKVLHERTVAENVEVALAVIGVNENEWNERIKHVLRLVGLTGKGNYFPSQLSGGENQRVSLARALVVNPDIVLADEPTGNLDWDTSETIMDIFQKINKEGKTIIMATHNEMLLKKYKHRVVELKEGKIK